MNDKIGTPGLEKDDTDWSHIKETVMMLDVSVAQIQKSMTDGDESFNELAESFTSMVGEAQDIYADANELSDGGEKEMIISNCLDITSKMQEAIIAFQFYDKLSQRMAHVRQSLSSMCELISEPNRLTDSDAWYGLQDMIKAKYTVESDKKMFDAILNGATIEEALDISMQTETENANLDDILLF